MTPARRRARSTACSDRRTDCSAPSACAPSTSSSARAKRSRRPISPRSDLVEAALVFRRFALEHPALFSIAFHRADPAISPRFRAARLDALAALEKRFEPLADANLLGGRSIPEAAMQFALPLRGAGVGVRAARQPTAARRRALLAQCRPRPHHRLRRPHSDRPRRVRGSRSMRIGTGRAVGLVIVALAVAKVVDRAVPGAHVAVGLGLAACLVAIAPGPGVTAADLGLSAADLAGGPSLGSGRGGVRGRGLRPGLPGRAGSRGAPGSGRATSGTRRWTVLVAIPLGTVLPEELAFRGLLLSLLERRWSVPAATLLSSVLFGLWHVRRCSAVARPTPRSPRGGR